MDQRMSHLTVPHSRISIFIKALKAVICGSIAASHDLTVSPPATSLLTVTPKSRMLPPS